MKFKKLVSALTLGTVFSSLALGTVSCLDTGAQEAIDNEFLDNWNLSELESQKERIRFDTDSGWLAPSATMNLPIIPEEGNITYDYTSSDKEVAVIVEKDGVPIIVAQNKEGEATITVRSSNNKIGYFKIVVSETRAEAEKSAETGTSAGLSDQQVKDSVPVGILINGVDNVKKITVVEGETITLRQTLQQPQANGLWKINWYYDNTDGMEDNQGNAPDYFYYNVVDSSAGTSENASSEGFWKNGLKMGYKVEVHGIKPGEGRKLHIECVEVEMDIEVKVIAKESQEAIPNIQVIGNKGNSVEMTGLSTSYITAVATSTASKDVTFTATSLTPDVCSVADATFLSGQMAAIKAEGVGTGFIKVSMGRASQIVKVVVKNEYITCLGNIQFSIHATKNVESDQNHQKYPKQRVAADSEKTRAFGTYFPTSANAIFEGASSVKFLTDVATKDGLTSVVQDGFGDVSVYDNGHFASNEFKLDRKFGKNSADSYHAKGGNTLYIGPDTEVKGTGDDGRLGAASGTKTSSISFAVHNNDAKETNSSWSTDITSGNTLGTGTTTTTTDTSNNPSPVFFVMDTGVEGEPDIATGKKADPNYTDVSLNKEDSDTEDKGIYLKKSSIISQYKATKDDKEYTDFSSLIPAGKDLELPSTMYYPTPYKAAVTENGDTTTYSYTFAGWYEYSIDNKKLGANPVTSVKADGKVKILVAKYTETATTRPAVSQED